MTIIVMGHIQTGKGEVARLQQVFSTQMVMTNAEAGCEHYSFAAHVDDPDLIIISERWATAEALAEHGRSAHMKEFNKALAGADIKQVSLKAWNGSFWRTLVGE